MTSIQVNKFCEQCGCDGGEQDVREYWWVEPSEKWLLCIECGEKEQQSLCEPEPDVKERVHPIRVNKKIIPLVCHFEKYNNISHREYVVSVAVSQFETVIMEYEGEDEFLDDISKAECYLETFDKDDDTKLRRRYIGNYVEWENPRQWGKFKIKTVIYDD